MHDDTRDIYSMVKLVNEMVFVQRSWSSSDFARNLISGGERVYFIHGIYIEKEKAIICNSL